MEYNYDVITFVILNVTLTSGKLQLINKLSVTLMYVTCNCVLLFLCIINITVFTGCIQGVRFVRDQTKRDDRLGQTKKKSPLPFCKIRNNY